MGYWQAGFDVIGVDIEPQPHYPFKFIQADALTCSLEGFDVIHASPPCQAYSITSHIWKKKYPLLIEQVRDRLTENGKPWIIENVPGSPLKNYLLLCGSMFGLQVRRHRWFENSFGLLFSPATCHHEYRAVQVFGKCNSRDNSLMSQRRTAMEIDWMNAQEIAQAIPPAYTQYIGNFLLEQYL